MSIRFLPPWLCRSLQIAITSASLGLLWRLADGATALRHLADADPVWIAAALLTLTLQTLLSALRWRLTASRLGISLEAGFAVREYYLSQIVNQLLPGGVLGDAGRAYRVRDAAGLLASGQAVLFERLAGQLALFAIFAAAVLGTELVPGGFDGPGWLLPFTLVSLGIAAVLRAAAGFLQWPGSGAQRALRSAFALAVTAPEIRGRQAMLSVGTALCNIAAFACCAAAVGAPLSVSAALVLVPLILLSMLIPLSVSGWGLREGAAAALLPLAGVAGAGALAASIAFGIAILLAALPGVIALAVVADPDPLKS